MNQPDQARDHAAGTLINLLDAARYQGNPKMAADAALIAADAIAQYSHLLCDQKLAASLPTENPEP